MSDWIAVAAFIVSLVALGVSVFELAINQPRLRVRCKLVLEEGSESNRYCRFLNGFSIDAQRKFDEHKGRKFLCVAITNFGTQPTTITTVHFEFESITGIVMPQTALDWGVGQGVALSPGQIAMIYYEANKTLPPTENTLCNLVLSDKGRVVVAHSWSERPKIRRLGR